MWELEESDRGEENPKSLLGAGFVNVISLRKYRTKF
jgi:hypothetical protein